MTIRLNRRMLSYAKPAALRRLARYLGVRFVDRGLEGRCACALCHAHLVDVVVRKLDGPPERLPNKRATGARP